MVEMEERDLLLASLRGYLEGLSDSGLDELPYGADSAVALAVAEVRARVAAERTGGAERTAAVERPAVDEAQGGGTVAQPPSGAADSSLSAVGDPHARLLFVVVGAGFEGPSGELLAKVIQAMGFATEEVLLLCIGSAPVSAPQLRRALSSRIAAANPEVVVALGEKVAQLLLGSSEPIDRLRGRFRDLEGVSLLATLHPDQMLADPALKREVWKEMQQIMARLAGAKQ